MAIKPSPELPDVSKGQELYRKARRLVPGATQLFGKRAELYLPEHWPAYYSRAKGCRIWDIDNNEYLDFTMCGIGTSVLGYADPDVEQAVITAIQSGNMTTLNCPEEIELAELLCELHPWAEKVRYARTGGEIMAVAVRIARAATGRDKIAFCGYHGWHDWYLAVNLGSVDGLSGHLLPGLEPRGVPSGLRGTMFPFNYNKIDELIYIVIDHV
jgi:glutamate-1-semialdehyde 2,1-aminomutase